MKSIRFVITVVVVGFAGQAHARQETTRFSNPEDRELHIRGNLRTHIENARTLREKRIFDAVVAESLGTHREEEENRKQYGFFAVVLKQALANSKETFESEEQSRNLSQLQKKYGRLPIEELMAHEQKEDENKKYNDYANAMRSTVHNYKTVNIPAEFRKVPVQDQGNECGIHAAINAYTFLARRTTTLQDVKRARDLYERLFKKTAGKEFLTEDNIVVLNGSDGFKIDARKFTVTSSLVLQNIKKKEDMLNLQIPFLMPLKSRPVGSRHACLVRTGADHYRNGHWVTVGIETMDNEKLQYHLMDSKPDNTVHISGLETVISALSAI